MSANDTEVIGGVVCSRKALHTVWHEPGREETDRRGLYFDPATGALRDTERGGGVWHPGLECWIIPGQYHDDDDESSWPFAIVEGAYGRLRKGHYGPADMAAVMRVRRSLSEEGVL